MCNQVVESCDCVDEETVCSDARVQGEERIQQVLSVAGNTSEQLAISTITDTGESERIARVHPVLQLSVGMLPSDFCRLQRQIPIKLEMCESTC